MMLVAVPFLLLMGAALSIGGGSGASAAAACQVVANGTVSGVGSGGAAGSLTPLQVEQYWVSAGGPLSGAVTAAALADAESADITDRIQGSATTSPTQPGPTTPTDPSLVGYGLWQITPGSPADYSPTVNAKIAVEKYEGSLAAGGGGWSPWTTYGTAGYLAALPAAQAAYSQLTAGGTGISTGAPVSAPTTTTATGTTTTGTTSAPTTAPSIISTAAADQYITKLEGDSTAQFAIVSATGKVLAKHHDGTLVDGASLTKAMILVAYLRAHPAGTIPTNIKHALKSMMERNADGSSTQPGAAWTAYQAAGGLSAVQSVATAAGMTSFQANTSNPTYVLGNSKVTALDFAEFFAKIDQLIPAGQATYGMGLLDAQTSSQQWGLQQAGITGVTAAAGGPLSEPDSTYVVNQAAQVNTAQFGVVGIAVTTSEDPSASNGENAISNIGTDLLATTTSDGLGYGINLSGLSAAAQTQVYNAASQLSSTGDSSQCANVSVSSTLPTVPGQVATLNAQTGIAAAPTGLPANVAPTIDKLIAAGNAIHSLPYIWGGGHGTPLNQLAAGYDCSGSTSYMLYQAGLLSTPYALVSGQYSTWGAPGPGKYVTIFSNPVHVFIAVDGIVMDTAWYASVQPTSPSSGPRWQPLTTEQQQINGDQAAGNGGFVETHPPGL